MGLGYLNVCRLCASSCEKSVPIFPEEAAVVNFAEKIKSYLHVEIKNSNDADDPRMCNACYERIINWDQYAEQVRKVQGMFLSMSTLTEETKATCGDGDFPDSRRGFPVPEEKVEIVEESEKNVMSVAAEKKREKHKKKKLKKVRTQDCEFTEEDEIPLSNHGSGTDSAALQKRVKEKEPKKVKPKIKLKIKPIKKEEETKEGEEEPAKVDKETEIKDTEDGENSLDGDEVADDDVDVVDDDDDDDDDDENSKDENKVKMTGVQSLYVWECLECHAPVKNWNALVKHCKEIHNTTASVHCTCGKFLQSRASIMKHRMKHTIGYGYKCEFQNCNKTFHRQQLLDVHSLSHMPKELQPWMCCKCSRRFHMESLLKQHEKVHLPKEEKLIYPCEVCQKKFCSKSAVTAHIRAVHLGERPFVCDQCGHSFTSKGILHEHLTIHSDVYNFHCKDCNKSFKTKYRLKIHMDTHVETRYQCPICTLTLNTRRTLRMHLLVHKDDKAFQCTTCGKAFKRSKDLKNHYNLHTGRRPYTCPFCQRTFANGSNCRSHKRRIHPEELKMYEAALAAGQQPVPCGTGNQPAGNPNRPTVDDSRAEENPGERDKRGEKFACQLPVPLNLQRNDERIKEEFEDDDDEDEGEEEEEEEEEGLVETMGLNQGENITTNVAQLTFQPQNVQYPVHNFYAFQSSGIPAFPGNPFIRQ